MEKPTATLTSNLHNEIAQIEQQLQQKRAELEQMQQTGEIQEIPHQKETLHEVVAEKINPNAQLPTDDGQQASDDDTDDQQQDLPPIDKETPSYLRPEFHEPVQDLVNTAFTSSIDDAVKKARANNDAALMDAFHDALVDELYDHLIERGKLKQL